MKVSKIAWNLAALALVAWPLMDATALAQRGERGGGGGDRGSARSGSGDRGGGGNRSGGGGGPSFSSGERSGGQRSGGQRSSGPSAGRELSGRNFSGIPQGRSPQAFRGEPNQGRSQGVPQRSFYRGPDNEMSERQRAEAGNQFNRQFSRGPGQQNFNGGRNRDLNDRQEFDRERKEFARDRDGREGTDRERADFNRGNRDDQFARDRERNGDRDREGDRNWNRSDWDRFGRGRDDWRRGSDDIRRNWYGNRGNQPFRYGWWDSYAGVGWPAYSPYRYSRWQNQPYYWWTWTPAARLGTSLVFGWDRPRYWGYGQGANIYYQDDYVYYDNQRTVSINDYYQQVFDLAHSVPNISEAEAEQMQWNPLGVFAVHRPNESESTRAIQLAVSNDGVITGTFFNRTNNQVHPLSGMVDERTQRAAWAFADGQQKALVFETGIYNLTRDESTMMVHFGPSEQDTEVWQLVRLEQPEGASDAAPVPATQRPLP